MPMYEYKCPQGHKFTRFRKISEYRAMEVCDCGVEASRVLAAPMVVGDYQAYDCPITGKRIEGRKEHEANLRRHGCRILEPGERDAAAKYRAAEEASFDAKIESTAEEFVHKLDSKKREQLGRELDSGLDVTVVRQ